MKIETQIKLRKKYKEAIRNLVDNGVRFCWTLEEMRANWIATQAEPEWKRLPRYEQSWLSGYHEALMDEVFRRFVVYTYDVTPYGRIATDSQTYLSIPSREICEYWSHTGAYAWKSNITKLFTKTKSEDRLVEAANYL